MLLKFKKKHLKIDKKHLSKRNLIKTTNFRILQLIIKQTTFTFCFIKNKEFICGQGDWVELGMGNKILTV